MIVQPKKHINTIALRTQTYKYTTDGQFKFAVHDASILQNVPDIQSQ